MNRYERSNTSLDFLSQGMFQNDVFNIALKEMNQDILLEALLMGFERLSVHVSKPLQKTITYSPNTDSVFKSTRNLFNFADPVKSRNKIDLKKVFDYILTSVLSRITSNKPLNEDEISEFHRLMILYPINSREILNPNHPYNIINNLYDAIVAMHNDQANIEKTTKEDESPDEFGGYNESYYLKGTDGKRKWVFKPADGEGKEGEGLNHLNGIFAGQGAIREHLASVLNYCGQYPVPFTAYVSLGGKMGSVQVFQEKCIQLGEVYNMDFARAVDKLPVKSMQSLVAFDLRFGNCDRHQGNILCRPILDSTNLNGFEIFGIDHGTCMSSSPQDQLQLSYLRLKQLNTQGFNAELQDFLLHNVDCQHDAEIMRQYGIEESTIDWMFLATRFLQEGITFSNKSKESNKPEIFVSDLAWILTKYHDQLIAKGKEQDFTGCFEEIIRIKSEIDELKQMNRLNEKNVLQMRAKMINETLKTAPMEEKSDRLQYINKVLFESIIFNYSNILMNGKLQFDV